MKKIFFFTLCLLPSAFCLAQQLSLSNQYVVNKFWLSPAYAGAGNGFEAFGTFRSEWMDVAGAPETKVISANGKICKNMGLGGNVSTLQAGIFTNISANASYAYHMKLTGSQMLSFGLGAGLLESHVDLSSSDAQNDPVAMNSDVTSLAFDASFGVLYRCKSLHAGFSIPRMLNTKIKDADKVKVYSLGPHYRGHIGYAYSINNDWAIDPIAVISIAENAPAFYEVAVPVIYKQKVWLAPAYKKTSMAVSIGGIPYKNFIVNYAYEFSSKGMMGSSGGSHEITIGWKMASKKKSDVPAPDSKKPYYEWLNK